MGKPLENRGSSSIFVAWLGFWAEKRTSLGSANGGTASVLSPFAQPDRVKAERRRGERGKAQIPVHQAFFAFRMVAVPLEDLRVRSFGPILPHSQTLWSNNRLSGLDTTGIILPYSLPNARVSSLGAFASSAFNRTLNELADYRRSSGNEPFRPRVSATLVIFLSFFWIRYSCSCNRLPIPGGRPPAPATRDHNGRFLIAPDRQIPLIHIHHTFLRFISDLPVPESGGRRPLCDSAVAGCAAYRESSAPASRSPAADSGSFSETTSSASGPTPP